MSEEGYNGWKNYETWCVNLWIDNDEGQQAYWSEVAAEIWDEQDGDTAEEHTDNAVHRLAERIESEHYDALPEVPGPWSDLLNTSLCAVSWHEIARAMVENGNFKHVEE